MKFAQGDMLLNQICDALPLAPLVDVQTPGIPASVPGAGNVPGWPGVDDDETDGTIFWKPRFWAKNVG